jgi:hypothetical protein
VLFFWQFPVLKTTGESLLYTYIKPKNYILWLVSYLALWYFDFECTCTRWWRLFQKRVVRTLINVRKYRMFMDCYIHTWVNSKTEMQCQSYTKIILFFSDKKIFLAMQLRLLMKNNMYPMMKAVPETVRAHVINVRKYRMFMRFSLRLLIYLSYFRS